MTIQAWTFLISRNQQIDYKTVVAPDFISQAKLRSLLYTVSADDFIEGERTNIRSIQCSEFGNFTVVFRSVKARSKDIGKNGNEVLKDSFGREIYFIEGLVLQSSPDEILKKIKISKAHFNQVHRELIDKYRVFWYKNLLSDSHAICLTEDESSPIIPLHKLEPFIIAPIPKLPEGNQTRVIAGKQSTRNRKNSIKFLLLLLSAIVVLIIWNMMTITSPAEAICKSTITIGRKKIANSQEGTTYLKDLKKKYSNQKSKDKKPQIWINLTSKNSGQANSTPTPKPTSKNSGQQTKDDSNLTTRLYVDSDYNLIDVAMDELTNKTIIDGSEITAIIVEPEQSKTPCLFQQIPVNTPKNPENSP
ncbi:MAG: hypothetical protein QNJ63_23775 [Calothrix sp. MO_192.B10]|nr:hypothetical protein [Calothrix sp. MO_192.B10]